MMSALSPSLRMEMTQSIYVPVGIPKVVSTRCCPELPCVRSAEGHHRAHPETFRSESPTRESARRKGTSNCKTNDHSSIQNHRFSGAILRSSCSFNGKIGGKLAFRLQFAVPSAPISSASSYSNRATMRNVLEIMIVSEMQWRSNVKT